VRGQPVLLVATAFGFRSMNSFSGQDRLRFAASNPSGDDSAKPQITATLKETKGENPQTLGIFGKTKKPTLQAFVDKMLSASQQKQIRWTRIGTNLECTLGGFPVRLAETFVTISENLAQFRLQVFPKGLFSSFKSPLFNVDILSSDPLGEQVRQVHQLALKSLPELYDSNSGVNKGLQVFDIGRSRLALVYHTDRTQATQQAGQADVTFFLKPKSYYYGFQEVKSDAAASNASASAQTTASGNLQPTLSEGYFTPTGYTPLVYRDAQGNLIKQGLSLEGVSAALNKAGVDWQDLLDKTEKLATKTLNTVG
jgi:hypothetical protein